MGRRTRRRERAGQSASAESAPLVDYTDAEGNVLTLRCSLTAPARREYAQTLAGTGASASAAASPEDVRQRALELLFERLAARWVIAGAPIDRQRELLARLRVASREERAWVTGVLREHCAELFPDVQVP